MATNYGSQWGMTIREIIATQAMAGLCANPEYADVEHGLIASYAVQQADALLKELKKTAVP